VTRTEGGRFWALGQFIRTTYAPVLHILFAGGWLLALDAGLYSVNGHRAWRPQPAEAAGIAVFFVVLFYLRVLDEWKDFDYDCVHNPDRPLVQGVVTFTDIYWFLAGSAALALAIDLGTPAFSGGSDTAHALLVMDLGYGLFLIVLEKASDAIRSGIFVNLLVTYPVNVLLSIYAYAAYCGRTGDRPNLRGWLMVGTFALAFLHYEFARKTCWPHHARAGKRLYSSELGVTGSVALTVFFGIGAISLAVSLLASQTPWKWTPMLALVPLTAGAWRFCAVRSEGKAPKPAAAMVPMAMGFLTLFYAALMAAGLFGTGEGNS
jgi:hypothetical protein